MNLLLAIYRCYFSNNRRINSNTRTVSFVLALDRGRLKQEESKVRTALGSAYD